MKNLLSILSFFISFACFGQMKNDTTVVCFPYKVAKQILLDLKTVLNITMRRYIYCTDNEKLYTS